jgi:hypothetical protein
VTATLIQPTLDLWGEQAATDTWHTTHQIGHYRSQWDWAGGQYKTGDLVPAWRCCHCGGIEMQEHALRGAHGCTPTVDGCDTSCKYLSGGRWHPYRMDAHWIPPTGSTPPTQGANR